MTVLLVDQFGEVGGAQKCLLDLIGGWPDPKFLTAALPDGPFSRILRAVGISTTAIPCGPYALGRKTAGDAIRLCSDIPRQAGILRDIIRRKRIDVVYVNGPRVLAGAALAARNRCPLVFHAHNCLSQWHDRAVVKLALRQGAQTIACCHHVAHSAGVNAHVIQNGVPDAGFHAHRYPPFGAWWIGIVGRISPEKGHLAFFDAVRMLVAEGYRIEVVVAGASQFAVGDHETRVRRSAAGLPVHFTGWTDDVTSLLKGLDLLAVPSSAEPGLPRVVLEAFSAGLPVVAAPTGGIPEAVRHNQTGFLAADSGAPALAECLRCAIAAVPADLARIAQTARAEWENHWNIDRWRREVIAAIRSAGAEPAHAFDNRRQQRGGVMTQTGR
jgi:glycosyltransferase involved in cell wall biosynthesis